MRIRIQSRIPLYLSLIVGDLIHNTRSALDQAAWLLACRSNPVEKLWEPRTAKKIAFPLIRSNERDFLNHSLMPFIGEDAKAIVEDLQPYKGGDTQEALARLDLYWNVDKHRVLHASFARLTTTAISFRPRFLLSKGFPGEAEWIWADPPESYKEGTEVARVRYPSGAGPPEIHVDVTGQPTAEIAFGSAGTGIGATIPGLGGLIGHVALALDRLETLRAEGPPAASTEKDHM
jgi:hypothetical protein